MENFYVTDKGEIGFGSNAEAAERDLLLNRLRHDITLDESGEFLRRRKELSPWMPMPNMLHISGIGCLVYEHGVLRNTATGAEVTIFRKKESMFYYISHVLGHAVSYSDIIVVLRPELDKLFQHISNEFLRIENYPYVMLKNSSNGFTPNITYTFDNGYVIGVADDSVGIKSMGESLYHVAETGSIPIIHTLAYIGYKLGLVIYEGVMEDGETS